MKYPVVITYVSDKHGGKELKYALRSLSKVTNWNGEVYIVGDREKWFSAEIKHIRAGKLHFNPWLDQAKKVDRKSVV